MELLYLTVDEIVVGERHRKDLGDIEGLMRSIEEVGLLHPIVVTADRNLVSGERRLEAFKSRRKPGEPGPVIPAYVVSHLEDAAKLTKAERDENVCRKDFAPTEAWALAERLRAIEEPKAKQRQQAHGGTAPGRTGNTSANLAEVFEKTECADEPNKQSRPTPSSRSEEPGETRRKVAEGVGIGSTTLDKIGQVIAAAEEKPELFGDLPDKMDKTGKVDTAYREMKKRAVAAAISEEMAPLPEGPFRVIVIDPPWRYEKRATDGTHRGANPYPDLSVEEICALPVAERAHEDCVLWLWTTNAFMRDAFTCLDAWGFKEKTILTWVKDRMGTGDWLRGKTEHCILAVRGKPVVTLTNQTTALPAPLREHSRKPDEFYALVEALCPGGKLEMFARQPRDGWTTWGAEENRFDAEEG